MIKKKKSKKVRVGITHGDINGIGYEIILKSFLDKRIFDFFSVVIFGHSKVASYHRNVCNINHLNINLIKDLDKIPQGKLNVLNCVDSDVKVDLGQPTEVSGKTAIVSLEKATNALIDGKIDVIVTAPFSKSNIQSEKFQFPGHTEYFSDKLKAEDYLMLMISNDLRIGFVSGHVPHKEVYAAIDKEKILKKIEIIESSLQKDFLISKPKIAVLSLNPHAGDDGLFGSEEQDIIIPAIEEAKSKGMLAYGPYAADGFFGSSDFKKFDAILTMYHDQGMIPFKTLSFDTGVNFTAGLPFVRTSPAHGTAFNIAGKNKANYNSFKEAVFLASEIFENRLQYEEMNKDPLLLNKDSRNEKLNKRVEKENE